MELIADLRYAVRNFLRSPAPTLAAVVCLMLGIAGTCAMFSIVYGVVLNPFVYKDSGRIVIPTFSEPDSEGRRPPLLYSLSDIGELRATAQNFGEVMVWTQRTVVPEDAPPGNANVLEGSANYFAFLGAPAMLGRTFLPSDVPHPANPPQLAVIGYRLWRRQFHGNPAVIGQELKFSQNVYKVIGVMPPRFTWFDSDIYIPLTIRPGDSSPVNAYFRLRNRVSATLASTELQILTERFARRRPEAYPRPPFRIHATKFQDWLYGKLTGKLLILMTAVFLLLTIACVNVCVLLISRIAARGKEFAVRMALGASTFRLIRQILAEALLLTFMGCVLGIAAAKAALPAILRILPETAIPHEAVARLNIPVLSFTITIALVTGALIGLASSLSIIRRGISTGMQIVTRGTTSGKSAASARMLLVSTEIALTTMLLIGCGVAVRNLMTVYNAEFGYEPRNVAVMSVDYGRGDSSWEGRKKYLNRLTEAVGEMPGVEAVAQTLTAIPPRIEFDSPVSVDGSSHFGGARVGVGLVSSSYFETLKVPLVAGRIFSPVEAASAAQFAVVNETFARELRNRGRRVVGVRIHLPALQIKGSGILLPPGRAPDFEIIGVVKTVVNEGLLEPSRPAVYVPDTFLLAGGTTLLIRTRSNPEAYAAAMQQALYKLAGPDRPLADFDTLEHILNLDSVEDPRAGASLFGIVALFALAIAAAGLYSVMSFNLSQRAKEFGIRIALGARPVALLLLIMRSSVALAGLGTLAGVLGGFAFGKLLTYYEQGWHPFDPVTLLLVCLLQLATAIAATAVPAFAAIRNSPDLILRAE